MKRKVLLSSLFVVAVVASVAPRAANALPPVGGTVMPPPSPPPPPAPDIAVTSVSVDADCHIAVGLANVGRAAIPASLTQLTLQMLKGGEPLSGWTVDVAPIRAAGATMTYTVPTYMVTSGTFTASIGVGMTQPLADDSRSATLSCTPKIPDLALSVTTNADCTKTIELRNVGDGPLMEATWSSGVGIQRYIDGMYGQSVLLGSVDPGHLLAAPGGRVTWKEPAAYRAYASYDYKVDYPWQQRSTANDEVRANVPAACAGTRPPFDLHPIAIALDASCRLSVTVRDEGPGGAPPVLVPVRFLANGVSLGEFAFDGGALPGAGSTTRDVGPYLKGTTAASIEAIVDPEHRFADTNRSNDLVITSLKCGG